MMLAPGRPAILTWVNRRALPARNNAGMVERMPQQPATVRVIKRL
jgi:hypothetical protein